MILYHSFKNINVYLVIYDCRVEKKKQEKETTRDEPSKKKPKPSSISTGPKLDMVNYKTMTGSTQYKFGVLAKIVKHMKARHQEGDDHPLTLEEILDETNQLDVGSKVSFNTPSQSIYILIFIFLTIYHKFFYVLLGQTMAPNRSFSKKS